MHSNLHEGHRGKLQIGTRGDRVCLVTIEVEYAKEMNKLLPSKIIEVRGLTE